MMAQNKRYLYNEEEAFFVDMEQTDPDNPELGTELTTGDVLDLLNGLEAALADAKNELSKAAMEINCAGPIDHRIRVLKREHAETLVASQAENKELTNSIESAWGKLLQHDPSISGHIYYAVEKVLKASEKRESTLRELLEKESLFDEVFIQRFHSYSSHDRGCTWDDATKGDVCTCGFQALVRVFFEIQVAKKAASDK